MFWALKFDVWDKSGKPTKRITARDRKRKFRNCVFLLLGTGMLTGTFECVEGFICSFPELMSVLCLPSSPVTTICTCILKIVPDICLYFFPLLATYIDIAEVEHYLWVASGDGPLDGEYSKSDLEMRILFCQK